MYTGRLSRPVYQDLDVHRQVVEASLPGPRCTQAGQEGLIFLCLSSIITGRLRSLREGN